MQTQARSKVKRWLFPLLVVPLVLPLGLTGVAAAQGAEGLALPEGAIQLSPAVPAMGEHWALPQDLPLGPIYLVWQGKVIGLEYMFDPPMMQRVEMPTPAGPEVYYALENLDLFNQRVDHMGVEYIYPGHAGFEKGHYDVHLYFITPEERFQIPFPQTPPSPVTTTSSTLPSSAIMISPVVPAMGEHWVVPGGWPWGPSYLQYNGELIGVEFEFNHEPLKGSKMVTPEGEVWVYELGLIPVGQTLNHMTIEYLPHGHEGMDFWHFTIHMYNITPEERGKVMPGG